ncbi:MAG: TolC family protein [Verrucomicrobia bacterium]|nr:TolC family protein [Verrucomicrobiota bacterium]
MRSSLIALIGIVLFANAGIAGETTGGGGGLGRHPLTITEAVELGLRQSPTVLNQVQELKRLSGLVFEAQAALIPQVTATGSYQQVEPTLAQNSTGTGSLPFDLLLLPQGQPFILRPNGTTNVVGIPLSSLFSSTPITNTWNMKVQITQLLYDGGAAVANRRAARINEDAAYYTLRDTIDTLVENIRTQFYQIILDRALVQVQEESVNLLRSQLDDQQSRYEAGTVPQFNVLQAESQLQNQIPQLISAQNNYRISQVTLAKTLGIPADRQYVTDEPLPVVGSLDVTPIKYDLSEALVIARANRPSLKAQRSNILAAVESVSVARAGWQPTLNASAGLEIEENPFSNNMRNTVNGWFFGVNGSWNILDGGTTYGKVKAAKAQLEESKVTFDDAVRQVELDVSTAVDNLRQAQETIVASKKAVDVSLESLRLANERLAAGTGTQLDVLNQQTQLTTARSNYFTAEFQYISAIAQYQFATATEVKYNDLFNDGYHPKTLSIKEAQKSTRSQVDSPLDSGKPATSKAKKISLTPPEGKISTPND